jgi:hypothetical protein
MITKQKFRWAWTILKFQGQEFQINTIGGKNLRNNQNQDLKSSLRQSLTQNQILRTTQGQSQKNKNRKRIRNLMPDKKYKR